MTTASNVPQGLTVHSGDSEAGRRILARQRARRFTAWLSAVASMRLPSMFG